MLTWPKIYMVFVVSIGITFCRGSEWGQACTRSQTLVLKAGWNSVFLEVQPTPNAPNDVFDGVPVDTVATFYPATTTVQFVTDPVEKPWSKEGWGVWYAPGRPEALFSNLGTIIGNRPYLIHATEDAIVSVDGQAGLNHVPWRSNSFNYVGFCLDAENPPTFADFFANSTAHADARFFRLVNDQWQKVMSPETTRMLPGEAYWIYADGRTAHQGPLVVTPGGVSCVDFGKTAQTGTLTLLNVSENPCSVTIELTPANSVPLALVQPDLEELRTNYVPLTSTLVLPEIEARERVGIKLNCRRELMSSGRAEGVLLLKADSGQVFHIPVAAER